jgi:signal transduction histidine kinase
MARPLSLRSRVALYFAGFGALLSLTMAVMLHQAAHDLSQRLIDETLAAELDDYIARRERNPQSLPPSTVILQGYVGDARGGGDVPAYLAGLPDGRHDVTVGQLAYRVAVLARHGERYYLLYDTSLQKRREQRYLLQLSLVAVAMTLLSALGGVWLSRTAVSPVAQLAARVRHRGVEDWETALADEFPGGEVGELARVFDRHLIRMRAFIERERAFSADVSHELRTALAVILSATEVLLSDERLDGKQKARIGRIERAARDMAELGTALLLMAQEERHPAMGGACVLAEVVEEAVAKHRHLLGQKPVAVEVHTNPNLTLAADRGVLDILVSNLIRNAFAYTASGTVAIVQDAHSLTVADTGKGIPGGAREQVFLRHFRDMASEGAGIGLSLVKRICDRYGWRVRLDSSEQRGTTVSVEFS